MSLTREDLTELYALRATLEGLAAKLAVRWTTSADLQRLATIVESMRSAARRRDMRRMVALDMAFHEVVGEASNNGRLIRILRSLRLQIRESIAINLVYDEPGDVAVQHEQLLKILESKKAAEFGRLMEMHVSAAGERAIRGMSGDGKPSDRAEAREKLSANYGEIRMAEPTRQ